MAAQHRCMNRLLLSQQGQKVTSCYSRHVGLAWLSTEPPWRPRTESARLFFSLLIRPERVTLGLHAWLEFHYPPCRSERHKPDCLCFNQMQAVNGEWDRDEDIRRGNGQKPVYNLTRQKWKPERIGYSTWFWLKLSGTHPWFFLVEFKEINFCDEYVKTLSWRLKTLLYYVCSS